MERDSKEASMLAHLFAFGLGLYETLCLVKITSENQNFYLFFNVLQIKLK